jgi:hypothetical protein
MERIVLEVDDSTANARISSPTQKKEKDIIQFLDELREKMAQRGLTQEILDDILKDEA